MVECCPLHVIGPGSCEGSFYKLIFLLSFEVFSFFVLVASAWALATIDMMA
jgi:hypothetical protein